MSFSSTVTRRTIHGDIRIVYGTFDADSTTTGEIPTGLNNVETYTFQNEVNEEKGIVDYTTTAGSLLLSELTSSDSGIWSAKGK